MTERAREFSGLKFDSDFEVNFNFDQMVKVDCTSDDDDIQLPANLESAIAECLGGAGKTEKAASELVRLVGVYRTFFNGEAHQRPVPVDDLSIAVEALRDVHIQMVAEKAKAKKIFHKPIQRQETPFPGMSLDSTAALENQLKKAEVVVEEPE